MECGGCNGTGEKMGNRASIFRDNTPCYICGGSGEIDSIECPRCGIEVPYNKYGIPTIAPHWCKPRLGLIRRNLWKKTRRLK